MRAHILVLYRDVCGSQPLGQFQPATREREAESLVTRRSEFLVSFSEADLNYLVERWAMKVRFCKAGDMKWGIYLASKAA